MPFATRRVTIMVLWAACILGAGPAIGYAQEASERLSAQAASDGWWSSSRQTTATAATPDDLDGQQVWTLDDPGGTGRVIADPGAPSPIHTNGDVD